MTESLIIISIVFVVFCFVVTSVLADVLCRLNRHDSQINNLDCRVKLLGDLNDTTEQGVRECEDRLDRLAGSRGKPTP